MKSTAKIQKTDLHDMVDKASNSALTMFAISTVIVVFCLVSVKAMLAQGAYQRRVVNAKHDTVDQLKANISAAKTLTTKYDAFTSAVTNVIGGSGSAAEDASPPDGRNDRIVLDALPTSYDFPALISSLTKLVETNSLTNATVGSSDDSASFSSDPQSAPAPVQIQQIPISGSSSPEGVKAALIDLERSIRPYDVTNLQISMTGSDSSFTISANTYYQPAKKIVPGSKVVK